MISQGAWNVLPRHIGSRFSPANEQSGDTSTPEWGAMTLKDRLDNNFSGKKNTNLSLSDTLHVFLHICLCQSPHCKYIFFSPWFWRGITYLLHIRAPNVSRSHLQQLPNEYGVEEQAVLHCLECQNWIHLHFSLVQIPPPAAPEHGRIKYAIIKSILKQDMPGKKLPSST